MDRRVLDGVTGRVVVLAGAARVGSDYEGASARTVAHYARLGVGVDVIPDPRVDHLGALAALDDSVGLVVLPGGSPSGLLDVVTTVDDGSIGQRLATLWHSGTRVSGASAGAMVLCTSTAVPDRSDAIADGLGWIPGMAIPHWSPGSERRWATPVSPVWGLPECGGVLVDGADVRAVGNGEPSVRVDGTWRPVSRSGPDPVLG